MIGKIALLAGIGTGTLLVFDRMQNGNWIWERTTVKLRLQQAQIQNQVQYQVQQQMRAKEAERQRKETEILRGRYASQAGWTSPNVNFGLSHY